MSATNQAFRTGQAAGSSTALRVLMADDDPQEHLLMVMASEGVSTQLAFDFVADGSKLLDQLESLDSVDELPNLIILDLHMPRLNGLRTLQELQEHPLFWQIPAIVLTNSIRLEDEALGYSRGALLFQNKPTSFSGMEQFLERAIRIAKSANDYEAVEKLRIP